MSRKCSHVLSSLKENVRKLTTNAEPISNPLWFYYMSRVYLNQVLLPSNAAELDDRLSAITT